eukprot:1934834-Rhodomonas_salina.5
MGCAVLRGGMLLPGLAACTPCRTSCPGRQKVVRAIRNFSTAPRIGFHTLSHYRTLYPIPSLHTRYQHCCIRCLSIAQTDHEVASDCKNKLVLTSRYYTQPMVNRWGSA